MRNWKSLALLTSTFALVACQDATTPTAPGFSADAALSNSGATPATVRMMDACDPATFAGVPGGCQRSGGVTFTHFIAQLTRLQRVPAWHFAPTDLFVNEGDEFVAKNVGGEVHTFTEVEEFGGGIVPSLNALAGLPTVAPECRALQPTDFIAPGGVVTDEAEESGDENYQCCIHPWMRMKVHVAQKS
ncbi:MAG: hypothetical protein ACJ8AJ_02110 [Gemmatimonadaceae bacterium]